jgi:hypothetical protein
VERLLGEEGEGARLDLQDLLVLAIPSRLSSRYSVVSSPRGKGS